MGDDTAGGISKVFISNFLENAVGFLALVIFTRELSAAQIGIFFLFQTLLSVLSLPADAGLQGAIAKRISEGQNDSEIVSSALSVKAILIGVLAVLIYVFETEINSYVGGDFARHLIIALTVQEVFFISQKVLQGQTRLGPFAVSRVVRVSVYAGVGWILLEEGTGVNGLVYALIGGFLIASIWGFANSGVSIVRPSREAAESLFRYGKFNFISHAGGLAYSWTDLAIIGYFLTSTDVAVYEVAWRVSHVTTMLSLAVGTSLFPEISRYASKNSMDKIGHVIRRGLIPSLFLVIPCLFGVLVIGEEILFVTFGSSYATGALVLTILLFEKVLQALHIVFSRALQGLDYPRLAATATVLTLGVNVVLNVLLVPRYGINGAAVATAVSFSINTVVTALFLNRYIVITIPTKQILWCGLSAVVMSASIMMIETVVAIDSVTTLGGIIIFGGAIYIFVTFVNTEVRKSVLSLVDSTYESELSSN